MTQPLRPPSAGHDVIEASVLYPELGSAARSAWRERSLRFRSYLHMREELTREYPDMWVAVVRDDLVVVASTLDELHAKLFEDGHSPDVSVIKYLYTGSVFGDDLRAATNSFGRGYRRV